MIFVRDDDISILSIPYHEVFVKYKIIVDIGIITSRITPFRWIKKHLYMYEICNHSHTHSKNLISWSKHKQEEDLRKANEIIKRKLGVTPKYFIPPYGLHNHQLIDVAQGLGLSLHPSYKTNKYYSAHLSDIIGKKEGWYVCHTSKFQPSYRRLDKNLRYLSENKLTRFWD